MNILQEIIRDHAQAYMDRFADKMPDWHKKVIHNIVHCRDGTFGQHLFECPDCEETHFADSSCGSRCCPVCQNDKAADWVERQQRRLLPCTFFLVTFTIPQEVQAVARSNQRAVYGALFDCASSALQTLEKDPRFVGCDTAGFFGVLHTWGRQLQYHPHIHFVVPGGGLNAARDRWVAAQPNFLVHVKALSRMYRGKMKAALAKSGLSELIVPEAWSKEWVVHCEAVGDGREVMKYLGAYVFRVAISASRILAYDGESVTFSWRKVGSRRLRKMKLPASEFLRRFLQHVLPKGFMKVRHYGFLSHSCSVPVQKIREMICVLYEILKEEIETESIRKAKPLLCKICGAIMVWTAFVSPIHKLNSG